MDKFVIVTLIITNLGIKSCLIITNLGLQPYKYQFNNYIKESIL